MSDVREAGLCSEIYDILEACTDDEIAPIVEVLVQSPASALRIVRAFERHAPNHHSYTDQIGDEVYRLALLSMGLKNESRPGYSVMLEGLAKQIGVPFVVGNIEEIEANILNTFASRHLLSVHADDRQRIVDEACIAASRAAEGLLSSDAWLPFASALLHLAYLRGKLVKEGRLGSWSSIRATNVRLLIDDRKEVFVADDQANELLSSFTIIPGNTAGWQAVVPDGKISSLLSPALEAVRVAVAGSQILRGDTLWKVAENGTAKIVEKGHQGMRNLGEISVSSLMGPVVVMALANALIEQRKLDQIEKSLADIKASLQDVSRFQRSERRSILTGSIRYFQQVAPSVLAGEIADEVLHGLERHEIDLMRVQDHLTEEARGQIATLKGIKKEGWGSSKYVKAIQDELTLLDKTYDELFLCIRARSCAYMLLCAFPGREAGKRARLDDITAALDTFSPSGEATIALDQGLREKLQIISSNETKGLLLNQENALFDRAFTETAAIMQGLKNCIHETFDETTPLSFNVRLQDGVPVAVRMSDPLPG